MKPLLLTSEEKYLVNNKKDGVLLEIIKGMCLEEMKSFSCYKPLDLKHYCLLEYSWLETERYLIMERTHREPDDSELIQDANVYHNFERFRVWYVLSFPEKVERED